MEHSLWNIGTRKWKHVHVTRYPETTESDDVAGVDSKPFPEKFNAVALSICPEEYQNDKLLWERHVEAYKNVNKFIDSGRYRDIIDMNAGLGSFSAALESPKLWIVNVMPTIAEKDTPGVIYERGTIGIYHDWCEAFSTYPQAYDLIHADSVTVFNLYNNKCKAEDILLEMDRILRLEGAVIVRDQVNVLNKAKKIAMNLPVMNL